MVKNPSKYDHAVFAKPVTETDPAKIYEHLVSKRSDDSGLQGLVDSIASEVRQWIESDEDKSEAASQTGIDLLQRCESIRTDFGPVCSNELRSGPPSQVSLVQLGYHHCLWRVQAYGFERLAGIGARQAMTKWTKGAAIPSEAIEMLKAGETYRIVAVRFGVSTATVGTWPKKLGLPPRKRGVRKK